MLFIKQRRPPLPPLPLQQPQPLYHRRPQHLQVASHLETENLEEEDDLLEGVLPMITTRIIMMRNMIGAGLVDMIEENTMIMRSGSTGEIERGIGIFGIET